MRAEKISPADLRTPHHTLKAFAINLFPTDFDSMFAFIFSKDRVIIPSLESIHECISGIRIYISCLLYTSPSPRD